MADQTQTLIEQVVGQLADVLAMTTGQTVRTLPAVGSEAVDWQLPLTVGGPVDAGLVLGMSAATANRLTSLVLMGEGEQAESDITDTLKEIVTQATAACVNQATSGLTITVGAPKRTTTTPPSTAWRHDLVMDGDEPPRVAFWTTGPTAAAPPARAAAVPAVAPSAAVAAASAAGGRNLDVVLDLELPITVRFGATRLTLDALSRLGPGSLIDLERAPDDPVELLVNGRLVARGEVVVVSGCYGVRVRDVVSAADRLRSLEG